MAVPGSQESLLIELVSGLDPDNVMPKKGRGSPRHKLGCCGPGSTRAALGPGPDLRAAGGAEPGAPGAKGRGVRGERESIPIDQILAPYFAARRFKPAAVVEDRIFARRVYLDAIGLLPPADDPEAFIGDERAGQARRGW